MVQRQDMATVEATVAIYQVGAGLLCGVEDCVAMGGHI